MRFLRILTLAFLVVLAFSLIYVPIYAPSAQAQSNSAGTDLNLTFTTIDVPGAIATDVYGINTNGQMVGSYAQSVDVSGAFLLSGGNFTLFSYPGASSSTIATGINDSGLITGWASVRQNSAAIGFLYDGTAFTTVRAPGKAATIVDGINNAGVVVGGDGTFAATRGFELIGGQFRGVSPPPGGWIYVYVTAVNNVHETAGWTSGANVSGFAFMGGRFRTIAVPGALMTEAWGLNDSGIIVGWYEGCSPCAFHGFALMSGKYLSFDYPGAANTFAFGINASGEVVGAYMLDGQTHGFVTSPITTATFTDHTEPEQGPTRSVHR